MNRCATNHGPYRCDKPAGHGGECATDHLGSRKLVQPDRDARRELLRAAQRIEVLEAALHEIRSAACDAPGSATSCACCMHDRLIATAALEGVT